MSTLKFFLCFFLSMAILLLDKLPVVLGDDPNNSTNTASNSSDNSNSAPTPQCGGGNGVDNSYNLNLHIGALFIILATSCFGAFIPVIAKKFPGFKIPRAAFFAAKHFGTGVILATAFIHMLPSAFGSLTNPCLPAIWSVTYTAFPGAFAMGAALIIFFFEYIALKVTEEHEEKMKASLPTSTPNANNEAKNQTEISTSEQYGHSHGHMVLLTSQAQTIGIVILEAGICFHSVIVGMALSIAGSEFISLLCALVFHQMFEGLGLGSRIAELNFPAGSWKPWLMSLAYGTTTPIGIAIGLGVRYTYDPQSQTALLVQGIFDSMSAGILLYAAMVELLAADFIMSTELRKSSITTQVAAFMLIILGGGMMALIGRWA